MWWLTVPIYVIGWMTTFRVSYLAFKDEIQREYPKLKWEEIPESKKSGSIGLPALVATFWPLFLVGFAFYKAMFPRGVKTRFDREQEAKERAKKAEEELREAQRLMDEMGIKHGYR